jgi:hypothetical protein
MLEVILQSTQIQQLFSKKCSLESKMEKVMRQNKEKSTGMITEELYTNSMGA